MCRHKRPGGTDGSNPVPSSGESDATEAYVLQFNQAHVFNAPVPKIEPGREFYPAEDYHQNF
ncbi:MAG TPA: hypothetical protein VGG77_08095 [Roseiarcus sp.]|jgi:peptide methionine sulfoxide reductase MsrA